MGNKADATRAHILDTAFALFAEKGYTAVTMQDICDRTGLSKGGLYRYYGDKPSVFTDLLERLQEEGEAPEKTGADAVEAFLEHLRQDLTPGTPNLNIAIYEFCVAYRENIGRYLLADQYLRGESYWLSLIERGGLAVPDPAATVATVLFLVEGLKMCNEVMSVPAEQREGVFRQIRRLLAVPAQEEAPNETDDAP